MEYNIRLASIDDCKRLSILKQEVWDETYRGIYSDDKIDNFDFIKNEEKFKLIINNENINLYVVEVNNELIGYMSYGVPYRAYLDYEQGIGLLYLKRKYQGYGIGTKLFYLAYENMKKDGYNRFFISCNKYNVNAQKFYEKMGGIVIDVLDNSDDKSAEQIIYHYDINVDDA